MFGFDFRQGQPNVIMWPVVEYGRAGANGELRKRGRALDASRRTCLFRVMLKVLLRAFVIIVALCGLAAPALARGEIFVDLSRQRMTVKKPGGEALVWKVSSGRSGFETPTGVFNVQRMDAEHFSDEYEQAPMPYAIFFSRGLAIHGSYERGL
jgi:hypothetical protein